VFAKKTLQQYDREYDRASNFWFTSGPIWSLIWSPDYMIAKPVACL